MTELIQLSSASLRCHIAPDLGGCITGLWLGDTPVLRSVSDGTKLSSVRYAGSYPLVPFSNRIGHATLQWNGTSHPLVHNFGDEPHAIHGVGWQRPWAVLEADDHFALLSYEHKPDAAWPFAFDTSQAFRLTPDSLELSLSITNQSDKAVPVGLGWHPFFVKRAHSHVTFEASGRWEMGADKLPTHRTVASGIDSDCAALDVDNCYDGWRGVVYLRDELLRMRVTSTLSRLVVFTNGSKDFIAVEPVSHINNALNMLAASPQSATDTQAADLGVQVLRPGESLSTEMSIFVEKV